MLPADWRETLVEMIRGASPLEGAWFRGGPARSPREQIATYREQFWLRLVEAVVDDIPGLASLLGEALDDTVRAYLADCPPNTWTLTELTAGLADWLEEGRAPADHVDMARLDRAVARGFLAADGRPLDLAVLGSATRLRLAPHVTLLRLREPLHQIRAAVLQDEPIPPSELGDFPLVLYRADRQMRHWEAPTDAWTLLSAFQQGASVPEAMEIARAAGVTEQALVEGVGPWFEAFGARGLLEAP